MEKPAEEVLQTVKGEGWRWEGGWAYRDQPRKLPVGVGVGVPDETAGLCRLARGEFVQRESKRAKGRFGGNFWRRKNMRIQSKAKKDRKNP